MFIWVLFHVLVRIINIHTWHKYQRRSFKTSCVTDIFFEWVYMTHIHLFTFSCIQTDMAMVLGGRNLSYPSLEYLLLVFWRSLHMAGLLQLLPCTCICVLMLSSHRTAMLTLLSRLIEGAATQLQLKLPWEGISEMVGYIINKWIIFLL